MTAAQRTGPLAGTLVVDLTRVLAGPYCTMLLSDLGARVIKVERPGGGDDARHIGPFVGGRSAYFLSLNRGKESIALDLHEPADRDVFERLLARADVLVENFRPGAMARLGYGWEALHARFPRLVYAAISGFGQIRSARGAPRLRSGGAGDGRNHVDHRSTGFGADARRHLDRRHRRRPLRRARHQQRAASSRTQRRSDAGGRRDARLPGRDPRERHRALRRDRRRAGSDRQPASVDHALRGICDRGRAHRGRGGGNDALFRRLAATLALPSLADDPRFADNEARCRNAGALRELLSQRLRSGPTALWAARLEAAGIPCGPIQDVAQVLADPQVRARNMVVGVADAALGAPFPVAGNPIKSPAWNDPATRPAAPALDADRASLLRWLDDEEKR